MADPSKISSLVLFNGKKASTEKIDERILELLGLQDEYELSYDEYIGYLREAMVASRMSKSRYSTAETESITNEWKRVKTKKGRFKPKKISAASFKKGSAVGINLFKQKALTGIAPLALPPATDKMTGGNEIAAIIDAFTEIIKSLTQQNRDAKKASDDQRKKGEQSRRAAVESKLEKGFSAAQKIAEKIIAPVKSLLQRIWDFFTAVFLGRAVYLLLDWFGKKENQDKVRTITRFLNDWWPALVGGFVLFGTKFGKGVRVLTRIALSGIGKLAAAIPALLRFGKNNPKSALAIASGAWAATQLAQRAFSDGDSEPKMEGRWGGGLIKIPKFSGGGFNYFAGRVSGQKGVDKIPAMLSDGEFIMSRGAVAKYGVDTLESMNAAGGGTNKPTFISGMPHAAGGGLIGNPPKQNKTPTLSPIEIKFATRARQRGISDPIELKAFLSQVKHESGGFGAPKREKYNSSPNDPPGKPGYEYFKGYANPALGLGNRNADDAYNYIGRGYLQITGRANYDDIGRRIGKNLVDNPQLMMNSDVALDASIEYWKSRVRPKVTNWNNTFEVSRAVNNPSAMNPDQIVGMKDRQQTFQRYNQISNKNISSLTAPKSVIKKEPSLLDRLSSVFAPKANAVEITPNLKQSKGSIGTRYSIAPPSKSRVKVITTSSGGTTKPQLGSMPTNNKGTPVFPASHPGSNASKNAKAYGIK
jgi:putative chitinase